jgi:hypothetical protein
MMIMMMINVWCDEWHTIFNTATRKQTVIPQIGVSWFLHHRVKILVCTSDVYPRRVQLQVSKNIMLYGNDWMQLVVRLRNLNVNKFLNFVTKSWNVLSLRTLSLRILFPWNELETECQAANSLAVTENTPLSFLFYLNVLCRPVLKNIRPFNIVPQCLKDLI